jgi:poly(beta-D-mannuronate) lyase
MRSRFLVLAALATVAGAFAECPAPPPAQRDIIADGYYDDPPVNSHIDPVKHAAYEDSVKPLEHYLDRIAAMASNNQSACTLQWLVAWAEGDAMLGKIKKEQAHYERKWLLAGLALSYAKVRGDASRDQKAAIDNWLQALADGVMKHSDAYKGERNNHYYWEGLAVVAAGAVTGNARDLAWGRKVFDVAMAQIADDGTFPREMARGARALHYHLFAAAPLAMLESILDVRSPKMHKLVKFCTEGRVNPKSVAKLAGAPQIGILEDDADWRVVYYRHLSDVSLYDKNGRQPYVNRLGGDLTTPNPLEHLVQN